LNDDVARCATCHTRESCARCHPNADRQRAIIALDSDARVARLVAGKRAAYFTPDDHERAQWSTEHAAAAKRDLATCANCHAQESCRSCHQGELGTKVIAALPPGGKGNGPGVELRVAGTRLYDRPARTTDPPVAIRVSSPNDSTPPKIVRVHAAGFSTNHSAAAASGRTTCSGCHEQRFCESCHEGTSGARRFHTAAYMSKHAADAYGQEKNCSSCHNTESFCRSCHVKSGLNAAGNGGVAAHTGQPAWLLQHGEAARQGLAGCTSCHQQRDCLRCHSTLSWKVNPHGASFDAKRVAARNKQMCLTCHVGDPLRP
jgi:doubled CXXCH motif protein